MMQLRLYIETFIIFCLFLFTDIHAYGYKKRHLPMPLTVVVASLALTSVNTLFYDSKHQYGIYLILLVIAGILYTFYFIDAHIVYSISLQLELICCYSVLKTLTLQLLTATIGNPEQTIGWLVLFYILYLASMLLCSQFFARYTLKAPFEHPNRYFITITLIPLGLLILGNLFLYMNNDHLVFSVLGNVLIIGLLMITHYLSYLHISSYNELIETKAINQHMELAQSHIERSAALVEQIRRDKHEMKNVYFYLNSLIESKDYDELSEFVSTKLLHRYDRLEEFHTGYNIIDYLLSQKACEARDAGISFFADIRLPEQMHMEKIDLCSILQNLLDNAIDASVKEETKDIHIKMCQQKDYLSITVKNRSAVDVLQKNPNLLTTKTNKKAHGIGTRVVRKLVEKYDGAIDYAMEAEYFVVTVLLVNNVTD